MIEGATAANRIDGAASAGAAAGEQAGLGRSAGNEVRSSAAEALRWQSTIAQYLLGTGASDAESRQQRRRFADGAAVSISELSALPIAHRSAAAQPEASGPPAGGGGAAAGMRSQASDAGSVQALPQAETQSGTIGTRSRETSADASAPSSAPAARTEAEASSATRGDAPGMQGQSAPVAASRPAEQATNRMQMAGAGREMGSMQGASRGDDGGAARGSMGGQRGSLQPGLRPSTAPAQRAMEAEQESRFAAHLSRGLAAALRQNGGSVTMRLQPEALGDVKIRVDLQPGRVGAVFEVANEQARDLLNQNLTLLRTALEARGMDVERLDVRLSEPAERGMEGQGRSATDGEGAGGAGEGYKRWRALQDASAGGVGGNDRSPGDHDGEALEALPDRHGALRVWQQAVEMGGGQVWHLRLDAIA